MTMSLGCEFVLQNNGRSIDLFVNLMLKTTSWAHSISLQKKLAIITYPREEGVMPMKRSYTFTPSMFSLHHYL